MIVKFQEGGIPPFLDWNPINTAPVEASTSAGASKQEGGVNIKDFFPLIKELEGLPNEAAYLTKDLEHLLTQSRYASLTGQVNPANLDALYVRYLSKLAHVKHNKAMYLATEKNLQSKEALQEFATTQNGTLIALDSEGKIAELTVDQYRNNPNEYTLQTNRDLLTLRAESPNFIFSNSIYKALDSGTSLKEIGAIVKNNLAQLGTTKIAQEGYSQTEAQQVLKGIEYLKQAAKTGANLQGLSVDGLYQHNLLTESQAQQAEQALYYIYNMLPPNMRALLNLRTGSEKNAINLIQQYVQAGSSSTLDWDAKLIKDPAVTEGNKGDTTTANQKLNTAAQFLMGKGYKTQYTIVNGTADGLQVSATSLPIVNKDSSVGNTTLRKVNQSEFTGIMDWQNVYMGNNKIDINALDHVTSDGNLNLIDAPLDIQALQKGIIKPDFKSLKNKELADQYIREHGITDYNEINQVYADHELPYKYDSNGKLDTVAWATFCVTNGYAMEDAFVNTRLEIDMNPLTSEQEIANALRTFDSINNSKLESSWDYDNWHDLWDWDSMYKGTIWIPLKPNIFNAMAGSGEDLAAGTIADWNTKQALLDKQKQLRNSMNLQSFPQ